MVVIFGLGFTGARVARRLLDRGVSIFAPVRGRERFEDLARAGVRLSELDPDYSDTMNLPRNAAIVVTIPPLAEPENAKLRAAILRIEPSRIVYISSTGVYGDRVDVDAGTAVQPNDPRGVARLEEERWMASGPWSSLILRSAAIYGPGRGVHVAVREGKEPRGSGSGIVSRIHVDDLAAIVDAGIFSDAQGAWPVADEEPCATDEIIRWCRDYLKLKPGDIPGTVRSAPIAGRRVDGSRICQILGVRLKHPSWRTGIPASLAEEGENGIKRPAGPGSPKQ